MRSAEARGGRRLLVGCGESSEAVKWLLKVKRESMKNISVRARAVS